jgi:hypothetical protein
MAPVPVLTRPRRERRSVALSPKRPLRRLDCLEDSIAGKVQVVALDLAA